MRHQIGSAQSPRQDFVAQSKTQNTVTEYEFPKLGTGLETWIRDLGEQLIAAYQAGNRALAAEFQSAMFSAIGLRSSTQQHRRTMEIDAAIWGQQ